MRWRIASGLSGLQTCRLARGAVDTSEAPAINRLLVDAWIGVSELYAQKASLEDVFLELTANGDQRP